MARKILLADDSVTAQNMGRRILTDAGYEVITVNNGSAALKKIAESKPDLIILDVYMPGYGGLEVCQRLKEAPETSRIPVLLSVGKLEPFKVDEARRVRADGHIIKPFEASELLTALTKLEDKIVPEKDSFKPGRFAKAIASAEQLSTSSQAVGEDSGWKSRLTIPNPTSRSEDPIEVQESQPESAGLRETAQREESKSAALKSAEAAVAAALPQGITPEELAALAAAANSFAGKAESTEAKSEVVAVSDASKTESISGPVESPVETPVEVPVTEKTESVEVAEAATFASAPPVENEARKESHQTPAQAAEMQRATTDAEVLAALASLSPSHSEVTASAESAGSNGDHAGSHHGEPVSVGMAASSGEQVAHAGASGPRWIAQSVAIAEDESTLVLEREMEKAYAAMAALETEATSVPVAETETRAVVEAVAASTEPSSNTDDSSSQIKSEEPQVQSAVAEDIPEISSPEAAAAPVATETVNAVSETGVPVPNEAAAYAAAASSGGTEASIHTENAPAAEISSVSECVATPAEVEPGRESELAAAWQNWKQIRESILGSQPLKPHATAGLEETRKDDSTLPTSEASSDSGPSESAAIANIVDSVLAELKPKLMEEISKKMKKDKKK